MSLFQLLGIVVAAYTVYAIVEGRIYARSGPWGRIVYRRESPEYFWVIVVIYLGLGVALLTVFGGGRP